MAHIEKYVNESLMLVTVLIQSSDDKASAITHHALKQNITLREVALKTGFISAAEPDRIVDPGKLVNNPHRDLSVASHTRGSVDREIKNDASTV
jgi:fumarate hydratase, class II